jgi:hypothetical protein
MEKQIEEHTRVQNEIKQRAFAKKDIQSFC